MTLQLSDSIASAIENLFSQLIAFQQTIADKTEYPGIPTLPELNLQCKLINCIDKLRRYQARLEKAALATDKATAENENTAENALSGLVAAIKETGGRVVTTGSGAGTKPDKPAIAEPPVTEQDFADYKHLIGTFKKVNDNCTIRFRGKYVNTKWLEYNLFQYCLPPTDRRFINDDKQVVKEVDYSALQQQIKLYLSESNRIAA